MNLVLGNYRNSLKQNWVFEENGQGLVEYALIIAFISLVAAIIGANLNADIGAMFQYITSLFP